MKKQLLLIGLIFVMFTAFAQQVNQTEKAAAPAEEETPATVNNDFCPHRIWLHFGGGYSNDIYKKNVIDVRRKCTYNAMAELGYTYFFHRNVGIGIGVGMGHTRAMANLDDRRTVTVNDPRYHAGNPDDMYDLTYFTENLKERDRIWAVEVPLSLQFEKKWGKHGIYAGVGVKGYFPVAANVSFGNKAEDGIINIEKIHDAFLNVTYENLFIHMDPQNIGGKSIKTKMRPSVDVIGDFGGVFGLSRSTDFYIGVYASYGFLNILPKDKLNFAEAATDDQRLQTPTQRINMNGFLNTELYDKNGKEVKWNLLNVGLKIGFHFLPCRSCRNDDYEKDARRKYMDEMMKKQKEPIVITNTVEYYYFVPTISQELVDEGEQNPDKKKALMDLAQSLSNIKILFDLDKDIPKVEQIHIYHIDKAVEVLKANNDFKVVITGYTSPEGALDHNKDLGHRRALAVKQIFINKGTSADQIAIKNYTAEDPQHKIDIPEKDWKEQRAVIFKIEKR